MHCCKANYIQLALLFCAFLERLNVFFLILSTNKATYSLQCCSAVFCSAAKRSSCNTRHFFSELRRVASMTWSILYIYHIYENLKHVRKIMKKPQQPDHQIWRPWTCDEKKCENLLHHIVILPLDAVHVLLNLDRYDLKSSIYQTDFISHSSRNIPMHW